MAIAMAVTVACSSPSNRTAERAAAGFPAAAEDSSFVLIDRSEPAFTVFYLYPRPKYDGVHQMVEQQGLVGTVELMGWQRFRSEHRQLMSDLVVVDDYSEIDVEAGLLALLERFPQDPFGLTWNRGIALTTTDYNLTREAYGAYRRDPAAYVKPARPLDPVHPDNHLVLVKRG